MKKRVFTILCTVLCFFITGMPAYAKDEAVTIDSVAVKASSVSVSGTTEAIAVTIQVRDVSGNIVSMDTVGTQDGKFSKSVTGSYSAGGSYTVYVADYEGGSWATATEVAQADPQSPSPESSDSDDDDEPKAEEKIETVATETKKATPAKATPNITEVEPTVKFEEEPLIVPAENIEAEMPEGISEEVKEELVEQVAETVSELVEAILNGDETIENAVSEETLENIKTALDEGKTIIAVVKAEVVDEGSISSEDKASIEEVISKEAENNIEVACYLDLSIMLKTTDGDELGTYNELTGMVTFTIEAPKDMPCPEGKEYAVIRIHNGESTILPVTVNSDGTLSFETDRFSSYALALRDTPVAVETLSATTEEEAVKPASEPTPVPAQTELAENKSKSWIFIVIGIAVLACALAAFFVLKNKHDE